MLPAERHKAILQLINTKGSMRVKELSQLFDVTEETVRRDLDNLEGDGKIRRSHGGAVRIEEDHSEIPYLQRESEHISEKEAIALEAVRHIAPGDRIVLDASTTAWHVALVLPNIPLTVLTNSLRVSMELASRDKLEVISTGGIVRASSLSYVGPLAEETLNQFHVNKAFLSCKGFHTEYGVSESNALQALVKRKMMDISDKLYLLADHSKMQVRDFTSVASLDEVDALITDAGANPGHLESIRKFNIEIIQA
ncbi:DeoR/GlpR family DNA-binding transcription regulator [Alicyclobacillus sp. SP_1]|uniref:DeoR/GlpR family DNA-binding transcription regulator n=1 Tax=Alicyclobacillus sp. SP_1 TaxID=2942475 RepID=UPI00215854ED|nr:DeoR/GlpR family DNA-binding transcription regulator [Alicyclobacillus sp. SP_1]